MVEIIEEIVSLGFVHLEGLAELLRGGVLRELQHRLDDVLQHVLVVKLAYRSAQRNIPRFRLLFATLFLHFGSSVLAFSDGSRGSGRRPTIVPEVLADLQELQ